MSNQKIGLHIFRRDLRLHDNTALIQNLAKNNQVIPCFIFTPAQIENNEYKSMYALQFLIDSLFVLDEQLKKRGSKLYVFYGNPCEVIKEIHNEFTLNYITINKDYTPFSRLRDEKIYSFCEDNNIKMGSYADALLNEPGEVSKDDGKPYTVFTYFRKKAQLITVDKPAKNESSNYFNKKISGTVDDEFVFKLVPKDIKAIVRGGEFEARLLLHNVTMQKSYADSRDFPARNSTSYLSAHHKFGTISIRETYHTIKKSWGAGSSFLHELYWRDFFTHIAWHFPRIFGKAFSLKFQNIPWDNDELYFEKWKQGKTGFPIVDAGMRELNATGFMHNRVRMVVASFLVKDLRIDWRWGERYFAQKLVDYDPSVNNGNWQWAASTGCDAQPYFRIFNPWRQSERFDKEAIYIKKWIPELDPVTAKEIHNLFKNRPLMMPRAYPHPIIDHSEESKITKELFKNIAEEYKINNS